MLTHEEALEALKSIAMPYNQEINPTETMTFLLAHINETCLNPEAAVFVPGTDDWPVLPSPLAPKPMVCAAVVPALYIFRATPKTREQGRARSFRV